VFLVFDTSVVLSALLAPGGESDTLISLNGTKYLACTSSALLSEALHKITERNLPESLLDLFRSGAILCDATMYTQEQIDHDEHVIGCLQKGSADMIVTYDHALIRRCRKDGIAALTPVDLLRHYSLD